MAQLVGPDSAERRVGFREAYVPVPLLLLTPSRRPFRLGRSRHPALDIRVEVRRRRGDEIVFSADDALQRPVRRVDPDLVGVVRGDDYIVAPGDTEDVARKRDPDDHDPVVNGG